MYLELKNSQVRASINSGSMTVLSRGMIYKTLLYSPHHLPKILGQVHQMVNILYWNWSSGRLTLLEIWGTNWPLVTHINNVRCCWKVSRLALYSYTTRVAHTPHNLHIHVRMCTIFTHVFPQWHVPACTCTHSTHTHSCTHAHTYTQHTQTPLTLKHTHTPYSKTHTHTLL